MEEEDPLAEFNVDIKPSNIDIDKDIFDDSLHLEQHHYDLGFEEGINKPDIDAQHDGKLLGIQTGFQKFLFVGALMAFIEDLISLSQTHIDNGDTIDEKGKPRNFIKINNSLKSILQNLNQVFIQNNEFNVINEPQFIDLYEKTIKNARGKVITLSTQLNKLQLYNQLDIACQEAIGKTPDNHITGDDNDLW